jgi:hypothetical protein
VDGWVAAQPRLSKAAKAGVAEFWRRATKASLLPYLGDQVYTAREEDPGFERWQHCEPLVYELRGPGGR